MKEGHTFSISIPRRGGKLDEGLNVLGSGRSTGRSHAVDPASGVGAVPLLPPLLVWRRSAKVCQSCPAVRVHIVGHHRLPACSLVSVYHSPSFI